MDKLRELIEEARTNDAAMAEYDKVTVEWNGGIPFICLGDEECTAGQATEYLDELCG